MCLKHLEKRALIYEIDPAHYVSLPSYAWDAMLKITKVKLELLTDKDMLLMFEQGLRGGISQAIHKYPRANNKYMKSYNKNVASPYIQYLDANNLHGWAMCKKLPIWGFKWASIDDYTSDKIRNYNDDDSIGAFLKVDIEYPENLRMLHKDLPFLCKRREINKTSKLVTTLDDKKEYVAHISVLKQALDHGLILKKVHKVIEFRQVAWMKPYIDMNTQLREHAKNAFEKDFFKLMNNAVFGRTMENLRKHRYIKLVTTNGNRKKLVFQPNFHRCKELRKVLWLLR